MYLTTNSLIETVEDDVARTERVLYIDRPNHALVSVDLLKDKALPVWLKLSHVRADLDGGKARLLKHDPWLAEPREDDELSEAERSGRDRAWTIIQSIVEAGPEKMFDRKERGRLIAAVIAQGLATKPTVYLHLYRYWQGGQTLHALIPRMQNKGGRGKVRTESSGQGKKRGRPSLVQQVTGQATGVNVDERLRGLLVKIGEEFYESKEGLTMRQALDAGLKKYFNNGYDILPNGALVPILLPDHALPTLRQFKYWYGRSKSREDTIIARQGEREYNLRHRPLRGESTSMAFGPGSLYQIDATVGDVYLVSSLDPRLIIGRPVIYVVIDTFSRLVVGFTVGLEGPSWMGMVLAFEHVATDKVEFCRAMGINITPDVWPVHHFPEAVLGDRGELESRNATSLVKGFDLRVANTPPYRADWKGIVERRFRLVNDRVVRWLPGAVRRAVRGDKDYRLEGAMTLAQLRKVLTLCFLEHNQTATIPNYPRDADMKRDRVQANPLELWHWGLEHRTGALRYFPPDMVRRKLLPRARATMTPRGLRYGKQYYTCDLIEAQGWRGRARDGTWREEIAYDPWSSAQIWLQPKGHKDLIPCEEIPGMGASGGVPWAELELDLALDEFHRRREQGARRQARVHYDVQIEQVKQEAKDLLAAAPSTNSKAQRLRDITGNRHTEKLLERQDNRADGQDHPPQPALRVPARSPNIPMFDTAVSSALDALVDDFQED